MSEKLRCMTSIFLRKNNQILMLYKKGGRVVSNVWVASAGGHFEENELNNPEACVLRELKEELGIGPDKINNLMLRYITLRRTNNEIRQNYYYFADLKESMSETLESNEGELKWFNTEDLLELEMPVSAKGVIAHYLKTGSKNDKMYSGITNREETVFMELPVS